MSNYAENKKKFDAIRQKYDCKGNIIFRVAVQYIVEHGQHSFKNKWWFNGCINSVDERHDMADAEGQILFMSRDFEKAILECAKELAEIDAYDLLIYVQKEVWLDGNSIDYQRAIQLCKSVIDWMICDTYETSVALDEIREIGFSDNEISELGFDWMYDTEMED